MHEGKYEIIKELGGLIAKAEELRALLDGVSDSAYTTLYPPTSVNVGPSRLSDAAFRHEERALSRAVVHLLAKEIRFCESLIVEAEERLDTLVRKAGRDDD